jgi:hypothetical protein
MIYEADPNVRQKLVPMFEKIDSTIVLSYLQGHMGTAWVNELENPTVAQITVGIFVFYAGNPNFKINKRLNYFVFILLKFIFCYLNFPGGIFIKELYRRISIRA